MSVRFTKRQFALLAALACIGCATQPSKNTTGTDTQSAASAKQAMFNSIDTNGDGILDKDEIHSWLDKLDTDGNGALTSSEWLASP